MHFEHLEKRLAASDRLPAGAALRVIALCSLAAWGAVLLFGAITFRILAL